MNTEWLMIACMGGGGILFAVGGTGFKWARRFVLPVLLAGKNVLIVSHGNAIRALMKYIESIPDEEVKNLEMLFGSVVVYGIDPIGQMTSKETRELKLHEEQMHA